MVRVIDDADHPFPTRNSKHPSSPRKMMMGTITKQERGQQQERLIIRVRSEERDENDDETRRTCCLIDALKVEMRANAEALWAIVDCIIVSRISLCVSFCRKRVRVK